MPSPRKARRGRVQEKEAAVKRVKKERIIGRTWAHLHGRWPTLVAIEDCAVKRPSEESKFYERKEKGRRCIYTEERSKNEQVGKENQWGEDRSELDDMSLDP